MTSNEHRRVFEVRLKSVAGSRFQPTGFPDIGAATFRRPDGTGGWTDSLVVESAQSMANRLEGAGWDAERDQPVATLDGLPYVRVVEASTGRYLTSSRTEAHRLAAAFVKDATLNGTSMKKEIAERLGLRDDTPLAPRAIAGAVMVLDPLCLVHGVFFAEDAKVWPGQPKIARALTGTVEAYDVERAEYGGVKKDHVRHSLGEAAGGTAEGYGTVPYHRTEWTAQEIVAYFVLDRDQLRSYGLGDDAAALLEAIAMWEVRSLLDSGLRLRTACDLDVADGEIVDQSGEPLADLPALDAEVRRLVGACGGLLGDGSPVEVAWSGGSSKKSKAS